MGDAAERKVDQKGRLVIPELADSRVLVEALSEHEFIVRRVVLIPAAEQWLYKNPVAMGMLQRGLEDLKAGRFVEDPTKGKDYSWLDEIDENVED